MPLDVGQIIQTGSIPDDTSLQFSLKWPDNNLAFVRKIVPDIKVVEGTSRDRCKRQRDNQTAGSGRKHPRNYLEVSSQDRYGSPDRRLFDEYNFPARSHANRAIERVGGWRSFWGDRRNRPDGWNQSKI